MTTPQSYNHTFNLQGLELGKYYFSPSFLLDSNDKKQQIWMRLQVGHVRLKSTDEYRFACFFAIDFEKSKLDEKSDFLFHTKTQFYTCDHKEKRLQPIDALVTDAFKPGFNELGHFDAFKRSWDDLLNSQYVDSGHLMIGIDVKLVKNISFSVST